MCTQNKPPITNLAQKHCQHHEKTEKLHIVSVVAETSIRGPTPDARSFIP